MVLVLRWREKTMLESDLRKWLRAIWGEGSSLEWVEHGMGGTPGLPDANLWVYGEQIPTELKMWDETPSGLKVEIRPVQRRYHLLAARDGRRTAFLVGVDRGSTFDVYLAPAQAVAAESYVSLSSHRLKRIALGQTAKPCSIFPSTTKKKMCELMDSRKFWEATIAARLSSNRAARKL